MRRTWKFLVGAVATLVLAVLLARVAFPLPDASVRTPNATTCPPTPRPACYGS